MYKRQLWWNLLDGWPQMSDAVVDYFFRKKLAYSYIKRAQAPFSLLIDEMRDWHYTLLAANDTLLPVTGSCRVSDIETGQLYWEGSFTAAPNRTTPIARIRMLYSEQRTVSYTHLSEMLKSFLFFYCRFASRRVP